MTDQKSSGCARHWAPCAQRFAPTDLNLVLLSFLLWTLMRAEVIHCWASRFLQFSNCNWAIKKNCFTFKSKWKTLPLSSLTWSFEPAIRGRATLHVDVVWLAPTGDSICPWLLAVQADAALVSLRVSHVQTAHSIWHHMPNADSQMDNCLWCSAHDLSMQPFVVSLGIYLKVKIRRSWMSTATQQRPSILLIYFAVYAFMTVSVVNQQVV